MEFQFDSLQDFVSMSGHGPYVWACYIMVALVLTYLLLSPLWQKKQLLKEINRLKRIKSKQQR